jgi:Tol biopolymer transport system component
VIGKTIGTYEILAELGRGGMGEVYRARDSKLERDVAIKVLPASVAADPERLARFEREAKTLASLNHPNIAHIYGVEGTGTAPCLVMELVEGEDLAAHIARGPMPLADVLPIARQIADALEAAHEQGIVHRDLKPANIKVRSDGTVKVLDFGLAKAMDPTASGAAQVSDASTAMNSPAMTAIGVILGTAAYMAPEQARGRAVDRRADIWAFGVVLYEMLTGRRAFDGDDISTTLASVLKEDVTWDALPADLPAAIRRLLRRCLEKDPKRRLGAIGDARLELDEAATGSSDAAGLTPTVARRARSRLAWIALGAVTIAWIVTLVPAWRYFHPEADSSRVRFTVDMPPLELNAIATWYSAISPDGRTIAYVAPLTPGGPPGLWVRPLDATSAHPLPGTQGGTLPFWSPDSRSLAFIVGSKLKRTDLAGGLPKEICDSVANTIGSWSRDNVIAFSSPLTGALSLVPASGGTPMELARPDRQADEGALRAPLFLPDGRHLLYVVTGFKTTRREVYVRSLDGGVAERLMNVDTHVAYGSGHLVFQRGNTLFAQPFDPATRRLSGEPTAVADGVLGTPLRGMFSVSDAGVLVYRSGNPVEIRSDLVWVDRLGKVLGSVGEVLPYNQVRLSPNEKRVVLSIVDSRSNHYRLSILDLASQVTSQLTGEDTSGLGTNDPIWSSDSEAVAFESMTNGKRDFFRQDVGGRDQVLLFQSPDDPKWLDDWSADGRYLMFHLPTPGRAFAASLTGTPSATLIMSTTGSIDSLHFSRDGKWFTYSVNESGTWETWAASFPDARHRRQISQHGGGQAWWRGDDREIFYLTPDGKMMSVGVTPDLGAGTLDFATPRLLFQSPLLTPLLSVDQYSVTRDGQRFLFIRPHADSASSSATVAPIQVVINWTAGLK